MKTLGWIALAVLLALIVRQLFPKHGATETITLPGKTDTVTVTVTEYDSITRLVYRDRPVVTTDTVVVRDTIWRTRPDTLSALPLSWYLTQLQAGQSLDSPTHVSGEALKYDGALTRIQSLEQYPVTLGPVTDIIADSVGIHVNFGDWPEIDQGCQIGCVAQIVAGSLAAGYLLGRIF